VKDGNVKGGTTVKKDPKDNKQGQNNTAP